MQIYLVRHTSVITEKGICYGQTDVDLSDTFLEEARLVKEKLSAVNPENVFTSPLSRCVRLAAFCGYDKAIRDDRLKELNFGDWEGCAWDQTDLSVWSTDWINPPAPNGESFQDMYHRVASFFDQLKNREYQTVLIFTHGGVITCARVYFQQAEMANAFEWMPTYGEIVRFEM